MGKKRITWTITVEPASWADRTSPIRALRWLLKRLGRNYGMKCVRVTEDVSEATE